MTEPTVPTSATPAPKKKGLGPLAWVVIGCLGLLVLSGIAMVATGMFLKKKVGEFAEEFEGNPAKAAATMVVKMNPDLELIGTDDDAGTMTVKVKSSGEVVTMDWSDIEKGEFRMETDEGEITASIPNADEEASGITITGGDGQQMHIGPGGSIPGWVPTYDGGSEPQALFSTSQGGSSSGALTQTSDDDTATVADAFQRDLEDAGYTVDRTTFSTGGEETFILAGRNDDGRSVNVTVNSAEGTTRIAVNYGEGQ